MKRILVIMFFMVINFHFYSAECATYMTYVAHLEPKENGGIYSDDIFPTIRKNLISFALEVEKNGQSFELLVSRDFILAERKYYLSHKDEIKVNLLQFIDRLPSAEVGIHCDEADERTNYADAVQTLISMGVQDHGIIGGTFYTPGQPASYTEFYNGEKATLTDFVWSPSIIHGLASLNHILDFQDSGVWKPSENGVWEHDPSGNLISIGGHRHSNESAMETIGGLNDDKLNTISIMIWGHTLARQDFMAGKKASINLWENHSDQVNWATFTEIVNIWQKEYNESSSLHLFGTW